MFASEVAAISFPVAVTATSVTLPSALSVMVFGTIHSARKNRIRRLLHVIQEQIRRGIVEASVLSRVVTKSKSRLPVKADPIGQPNGIGRVFIAPEADSAFSVSAKEDVLRFPSIDAEIPESELIAADEASLVPSLPIRSVICRFATPAVPSSSALPP